MKRKGIKIAAVLVVIVGVFAWLFDVDRNPGLKYHPTDGMAMVSEFVGHLSKDGADISPLTQGPSLAVKSPADTANYEGKDLIKKRPLIVEWVRYVKGDPKLLRQIGSLVNHPGNSTRVGYCAVAVDSDGMYFQFEEAVGGGGGFTSDKRVTFLGTMQKVREKTLALPNNSEIRAKSSFFIVQLGPEVRVYGDESLPQTLNPIREVLKDASRFKTMIHMSDK